MVTVEQLKKGIGAYADKEILDRLPVGTMKRVLVGSAIAMALQNSVEPFLNGDTATALGICKDGMIDTEMLRDVLKQNIPVDGVKVAVPFVGVNMTFRPSDIDVIYGEVEANL